MSEMSRLDEWKAQEDEQHSRTYTVRAPYRHRPWDVVLHETDFTVQDQLFGVRRKFGAGATLSDAVSMALGNWGED